MTHSVDRLTRAIRSIEAAVEASKAMLCEDAVETVRDATRAGLIVVAEVRDDLEAQEVSEPTGTLDEFGFDGRRRGW